MLTAMTEEDWALVLDVFRASRSRRGEGGRAGRKPRPDESSRATPMTATSRETRELVNFRSQGRYCDCAINEPANTKSIAIGTAK